MLPILGGLLGGIAKRAAGPAVKKLGTKLGGFIGRVAGKVGPKAGAIVRAGAPVVAGAGATVAIDRAIGGGGDNIFGLQVTADAYAVEVLRAPPGYVLISNPDDPDEKIAVLKEVAYALGLRRRPRRGGGITAREVRAAYKVQRFVMGLTTARQPKMRLKRRGRR